MPGLRATAPTYGHRRASVTTALLSSEEITVPSRSNSPRTEPRGSASVCVDGDVSGEPRLGQGLHRSVPSAGWKIFNGQ